MSADLLQEDYLMRIRDKLRKDNVKLWLEPYYTTNSGINAKTIEGLSQDYSTLLKIPFEICFLTIQDLQKHSLENLEQQSRFKASGLATIKIKILNQGTSTMSTKEIMLTMRAMDLKEVICGDLNVLKDRIKLISSGKVLTDNESLVSQGVKNGQQILALLLSEPPNEIIENENRIKEMECIKSDSRLLALDNQYMQLEDQFGNPVNIPANERKALVVAMALHEKGKTALKKNDVSRALVFFLEADEEFRQCNSQLLNSVDNYALLDLDIAWCYLCLKSFVHLPEAHIRLKRCEQKFHSTYGNNLERLIAVKGSTGNETALFMRMHLLQAIVLYYKNNRDEALTLLRQAGEELKTLKVDEEKLMALVELGFTVAEARLGLRASKNDINQAANYIKDNRDKRAESRKKALAEEILKKESKKLGKCLDGKQHVDPRFLKILVGMGYNKEAARVALQNSNNIISDSIQYIQENPNPGPSTSKSTELLSLINDLIPELTAAGFASDMAKLALHKHSGDIMKAAEDLLANNGILKGDLSDINIDTQSLEDTQKKQEEKDKAFKRLAEDITMVDDDHLDLTLDQEEMFLKQYLSLLEEDM